MMPDSPATTSASGLRADPATALLPIVLVTSLDPQGERVKGIEAGADDFLPKPINQAELFARVRFAAAGQIAAGRGEAPGRGVEGMQREARGARERTGDAAQGDGPAQAFFRPSRG
jgi:DNA-binding response OmpR family regulator